MMRLHPVAFAVALVAAGAAFAQSGTKEERTACRPDVRRFCGHIRGDENQKYRDCLQSHIRELSPKCQQALMGHSQGQ
jgi:hypothetical protein